MPKAKRPWTRPPGCQCDASEPVKFKCTAQWMRCRERIAYVMRTKGAPTMVKTPQKLRPADHDTTEKE